MAENIDPNWVPPVANAAPEAHEDPVEALKAQLAQEKEARIAAEQRANIHAQTAHRAQLETADNQLQLVSTAIDRVKEQTANLRSAYAEAMRAQDFDAAATFQEEMSANAAKLLQLENGKAAMQAQPKPEAPRPANPVEALAAQLTPKSAEWVRAHPEFVTDAQKYQGMIGAHNAVTSRGIAPDTDEYFAAVETALGIGRKAPAPVVDEDATAAAAKPMREASSTPPPAAPVSRGSGSSRAVRLTADQIEMAEMSGVTPEEYARNLEALRKEGRMS